MRVLLRNTLVSCALAGAPSMALADNLLSLTDVTVTQGETIVFTADLDNEEPVYGLQYNLVFDPDIVTVLEAATTTRSDVMIAASSLTSPGEHLMLMFNLRIQPRR